MAQIREIKKRMVAVATIQRITKTMQMIATAKFTSSLQRARATRPYTDKIRELVAQMAASSSDELDDPLVNGVSGAASRELVLVVSSDRGLCGAYNSHVLRIASRHLAALKAEGVDYELQIVGKKAAGYFAFAGIPVSEHHTFGDNPDFEQVAEVASSFITRFAAGEFSSVRVAYMKFISNARQEPEMMQLLPMRLDEVAAEEAAIEDELTGVSYEFSPSVEQILTALLPRAVKTSLFQAINDAIVSEQVMRMIAMKAASDNATGLGRTLKRDFNRARQSKITTELTEIVSGAAALE
ncbi:MAG: ATP synthase F1 subunit gamma [Phycisphaerales bacterium]|nr:ATP synthase F1 subunit gamma [Phycisphaerales bacterium]